jgi:hypothetical protein
MRNVELPNTVQDNVGEMTNSEFLSCVLVFFALAVSSLAGKSGGERLTILKLPHGITIGVPSDWRIDDATANKLVVESRSGIVDLSEILATSGHVILVGSPMHGSGEASVEIGIVPSDVSQTEVAAMQVSDMAGADRQIRDSIEALARKNDVQILAWYGTSKDSIGSKYALVSRYRYEMPKRIHLNMESYSVYLGSSAVHVRFQYSDQNAAALRESLDEMKNSFLIK